MENMMQPHFQFEVGRLLCAEVRDFLQAEKLKGRIINWHEGSGWFSRVFTVSGHRDDVDHIRRWAQRIEIGLAQSEAS